MQVEKLAPYYTSQDLAMYLLNKAIAIGLAQPNKSLTPLKRGYDHVLRAFDHDRCLLVLVTDHLLEGGYVREVGVGSKLVTPGVFDVAVREMGGEDQPWKYLYYRRFAQNWHERTYFTYWIGALTDAEEAPLYATPPEDHTTWYDVAEEARKKLDTAVKKVNSRLKELGVLEEWPDLGPPPRVSEGLFVRNPSRLRWGHVTSS